MKTKKKDSAIVAKEKLLRYLQSKAYPVIPLDSTPDAAPVDETIINTADINKERNHQDPKDAFIHQLKHTLKDPCIFVHLPEEDLPED
jgi:hypothetical protein